MKTIDNRDSIYQLDEIYKYKDLINASDRDVIKRTIFNGDEKAKNLHNEFVKLVAMEVDHQINKTEFSELKDKLIAEMQKYLA